MIKHTPYSTFLRLHLTILIALPAIALFNWFVDPYDIHHTIKVSGFNEKKPVLKLKSRINKAHKVNQIKPKAVILGTSRSQSIPSEHPGWDTSPVYDLSLPASNFYEIMRYFQHAHAAQPLEQVVLSLDFFMFNAYKKPWTGFKEDRLNVDAENMPNNKSYSDFTASLFSIDSIVDSYKTITGQAKEQNRRALNINNAKETQKDSTTLRSRFILTERGFLKSSLGWFPKPHRKFSLIHPLHGGIAFAYLRSILAIAYEDNINMVIFISPIHARLLETMHIANLWPQFEEWKRLLVKTNEREARRARKKPFSLWDFSGYNSITTEELPAIDKPTQAMKWYNESSHYTKTAGILVLNRLFNTASKDKGVPDDFGVMITTQNIEGHLESIRASRKQYVATHTEDVSEIRELIKRLNKSWLRTD